MKEGWENLWTFIFSYLCEEKHLQYMMSEDFLRQLPRLRECLANHPIEKAWLFGSCARGEERPSSDIDLLVQYDKEAKVSIFTVGHISYVLSKELGREVDLIEEGCLCDFARETAEKDKTLIYERKDKRQRKT